MANFSPGFHGRRRPVATGLLPPGQYPTDGFPVLSAGPTPRVLPDAWEFSLTTEDGTRRTWSWAELQALPHATPTVDIHCVTKWSKFGTSWEGVSFDTLLDGVETAAPYALVHSYGGYTTNLPLADLRGGKAWIVFSFDGKPLDPEHGGPARLLVPHLYFWKSAKWVRRVELLTTEKKGFWERVGYHNYGDPWREQRYDGD
ncbi:molybdopterin-dependent oxidoreductase [Cryptosporangium phraense]|uniref:molybdopterin-dependent oxidoreductase n=1 Tax=Cryptosporangium phraense TaxID=2593070 RepID=UPI001F0EB7EB|nr:molybdopterin-dependent oxidoreductase [Cryptosporangium phraense]